MWSSTFGSKTKRPLAYRQLMFQAHHWRQGLVYVYNKSKTGNVTFGNDESSKIKGKGMVSLSNGKGKA
jgi:hypothetical protein